MKVLFTTILIAIFLFSLIILLDLIMGFSIKEVLWKAWDPFRVMDPAETAIIFLMVTLYALRTVVNFIKKKKNKNQTSG